MTLLQPSSQEYWVAPTGQQERQQAREQGMRQQHRAQLVVRRIQGKTDRHSVQPVKAQLSCSVGHTHHRRRSMVTHGARLLPACVMTCQGPAILLHNSR